MSFERALWLFPAVLTLHNLEEALWMPRWSALHRFPTPGPRVFAFAATIFTVLGFVVTALAIRSGPQSLWALVVFGYMVGMLANILVPHLLMTILRRCYMPGLGTGLVLNAPVLTYLVVRAVHQHFVAGPPAILASILVPLTLAALIRILFALGRLILP